MTTETTPGPELWAETAAYLQKTCQTLQRRITELEAQSTPISEALDDLLEEQLERLHDLLYTLSHMSGTNTVYVRRTTKRPRKGTATSE